MDESYYYASETGAPTPAESLFDAGSGTYQTQGYYAAQSEAFKAGDPGYFNREIASYSYVTDGSGAYSFIPDAAGEEHVVSTDTVYYLGSVSNNNWFLKDVFDIIKSIRFAHFLKR